MMRPETIHVESFGEFHLWQKTLNGYEYFNYSREIDTSEGKIKIVLHPPESHSDWSNFAKLARQIIDRARESYREIFLSRWFPVWNLLRGYGDWSVTPARQRKLAEAIQLKTIKIVSNGDHEIILNGILTHDSLDLYISFNNEYRMTSAWFDG